MLHREVPFCKVPPLQDPHGERAGPIVRPDEWGNGAGDEMGVMDGMMNGGDGRIKVNGEEEGRRGGWGERESEDHGEWGKKGRRRGWEGRRGLK